MDTSDIIVMTGEGRFAKIPLAQRNCQIGEEIFFTEVKPKLRKPWILTSSFIAVAAAVLLLLFNLNPGSSVVSNKQIVAYVSIDINPSVEMGIDEHNIVLEIRGLNADGVELIKDINFAGKPIDRLTEDLLQKAEKKYLSKGEGDIIISSTMGENGNVDSKVNDVVLSTKLKEVVVQHIEKVHPEQKANYQVTAFAADKEVRKAAESKGLSAGKYTIYLNAKDKGQDTTIEDLKKQSIHVIAKNAGGIDKLIDSEDLSKDKTSKLLKEDESGDLDRKLNNSKNAKKNEDKNNTDKSTTNMSNTDISNTDVSNTDESNTGNSNTNKSNTDMSNTDKSNSDKNNNDKKSEGGTNEDKKSNDKKNDENKQSISDFFNKIKETAKPINDNNSTNVISNMDERQTPMPTPTPISMPTEDNNEKKNNDNKSNDNKNEDTKNEGKKNEDKKDKESRKQSNKTDE
jgi:hypothetical protein